MKKRDVLFLMGVLLTWQLGCASHQRPADTSSSSIPLALSDALEVAREVLTEQGFAVVAQGDGTIVTTLWRESFMGSNVAGVWTRYSVFAAPRSETETELRAIRVQRYAAAVIPRSEHGPGFAEENPNEVNEQRAPTGGEHRATATLRGDPTEGDADTFYPKTHSSSAARDFTIEAEIQRRALARLGKSPTSAAAPPQVSEQAASAPAQLLDLSRCGEAIPGLDDLDEARTLVFGEVPGTNEAPRFIGAVVCRLLVKGRAVAVALEVPKAEQQRVNDFLESAGSPDDVAALLEGFFWSRPDQDGRSSRAVLALLQQLQTFRLAGLPVRALAMDEPALTGSARAKAMADALAATPNEVLVVLVGNLNARVIEESARTTLASYLSADQRFSPMLALDMAFSGGSAWTCELDDRLECGITRIQAGPAHYRAWGWSVNRGPDFRLRTPHVRRMALRHKGIDGTYYLGALSASPPALSPDH